MAKRASLEELKDFANKVRAAGGGNPIDALLPAIPQDPDACLIAKNLNFNCRVTGGEDYGLAENRWVMIVDEKETRDRIADALGLAKRNAEGAFVGLDRYAVALPENIGQVASDFDSVSDAVGLVIEGPENAFYNKHGYWPGENGSGFDNDAHREEFQKMLVKALKKTPRKNRRLIKELVPYIIEASAEARTLATLITEDGSVVV